MCWIFFDKAYISSNKILRVFIFLPWKAFQQKAPEKTAFWHIQTHLHTELPYLPGKQEKCIMLQRLLKIILTVGLMQQGLFCFTSAPRASVPVVPSLASQVSFQNIDPWCVLVQEWEFWSFSRASLMKTGFEGRLISRVSGLVLVDDVLLQTGSLPCVGLFGEVQVRISLQLLSIAATFFTHSCFEWGGVPGGKVSGVLWGKTRSAVTNSSSQDSHTVCVCMV